MIATRFNANGMIKDISNIIDYSIGFLDGVKSGRKIFLDSLALEITERVNEYIDAMASVQPSILQHVYEWNLSGNKSGRLFEIKSISTTNAISFSYSFKQSMSIKNGSNKPFYDKARIMELGIPVTVRPKRSGVLAFEIDGEQVFTKKPIEIKNPGGEMAAGGFEKTVNSFFKNYFSQSFLNSSGVASYLRSPLAFKKNLSAGKAGGRSLGFATGHDWITKAGAKK